MGIKSYLIVMSYLEPGVSNFGSVIFFWPAFTFETKNLSDLFPLILLLFREKLNSSSFGAFFVPFWAMFEVSAA